MGTQDIHQLNYNYINSYSCNSLIEKMLFIIIIFRWLHRGVLRSFFHWELLYTIKVRSGGSGLLLIMGSDIIYVGRDSRILGAIILIAWNLYQGCLIFQVENLWKGALLIYCL